MWLLSVTDKSYGSSQDKSVSVRGRHSFQHSEGLKTVSFKCLFICLYKWKYRDWQIASKRR